MLLPETFNKLFVTVVGLLAVLHYPIQRLPEGIAVPYTLQPQNTEPYLFFHGCFHPAAGITNPCDYLSQFRDHQLAGCSRCSSPQVGYKVGNGIIRLVPYGGYNRHIGLKHRLGYPFIIEGPKFFNGPSAPPDYQHIHRLDSVKIPDTSANLFRGSFPLYQGMVNKNLRLAPPAVYGVNYVLNRRPLRRGNHSYGGRHERQLFLFGRIEISPLLQGFFQLFKGLVKLSQPVLGHFPDIQLVLAVPFVYRNASPRQHFHPVGWFKGKILDRLPKHHTSYSA